MRRWLLIVLCAVLVVCLWKYYGSEKATEDAAVEAHPPQTIAPIAEAHPPPATPIAEALRRINNSRSSHGLPPVNLDDTASRAAQRHCEAMAAEDFFGHIGLNGSRPFHRYNLDEGGDGHIAENVCLFKSSTAIATDQTTVTGLAIKGHGMFMAEVPPDDGHRRNILEKRHNYIGIGAFVKDGNYTYCEEFLDKYIEISGPSQKTIPLGDDLVFTGRVIDPGQYGLYMVSVTYDAALIPPANPKSQPTSYKDAGAQKATIVPPWDFNKDGRHFDVRSGEFSISIKIHKKGYYYIIFYLKEDPSSIPYAGGSARVSTEDGFAGGAQVIRVI
ncbi:MAG: CAP domain-containing protein [Nitrospirae bacterium]|nr:CAP domain-containing protein [Nitrospirota bacterium]